MDGNFVADLRLEDTDEVLQMPIIKNKLKKLLASAVKKMAVSGSTVIPSSDDPLDVFLQAAGKFFGKDPTYWEQMGEPTVEVSEESGFRTIKTAGLFSGIELQLMMEEPYYDERLPVREDFPELNFNERKRPIPDDMEWQHVMSEQPMSMRSRRQKLSRFLHAKLDADDNELATEGSHGLWEMSINKDHHVDIDPERLVPLVAKLSSTNVKVATTAAAAVWGFAISSTMRRYMAELEVVDVILKAIKDAMKLQVSPDPPPGEELPENTVGESERSRLVLHLLGALAVLLVDRCCRAPYLNLEPNFETLISMCQAYPGVKATDEQVRRETAAKILTSLIQRDGDARLSLIQSGSLRSVMSLLNPEGPGANMIQFCMASLLATMVLDDDAMDLIRDQGEAPILFESCIILLISTLSNLHAELDRRTSGYYEAGDVPVFDLYLGVRLAEASSQAMWGSAHYCIQMEPVQIQSDHIMELGKMGKDCVLTEQLPLSRVCHCITATLATLASHPTTADLIVMCPGDEALSALMMLVDVQETEVFEQAGHVKASACAGVAFLACHPIGALGDECMNGPYRKKLLEMGAFSGLLRAALNSSEGMDMECDLIIQQAAAIGIMYLSTMAGAVPAGDLAMYAALLMDSDNSEMIEFLMAGMWILLRNGENRKTLSTSFTPAAQQKHAGSGANAGGVGGNHNNMANKLNDAITLHEIHDQAQEKAAKIKEAMEQIHSERSHKGHDDDHHASPLPSPGRPGSRAKHGNVHGPKDHESGNAAHCDASSTCADGSGAVVEEHAQAASEIGPASALGSKPTSAKSNKSHSSLHPRDDGSCVAAGYAVGEDGTAAADGNTRGMSEGGCDGGVEDSNGLDGCALTESALAVHDDHRTHHSAVHDGEGHGLPDGEVNEASADADATSIVVSPRPLSHQQSLRSQLGSDIPAAGLGAMSFNGKDRDGNNLPRGGGEEGGAPDWVHESNAQAKKAALKNQKTTGREQPKLLQKYQKQLKDNWGLETLVNVGESWLPAMLEQDAMGEATDIPVLKLFEFLVASICLFMIDDDSPGEQRQLDLFKLSAPRVARGAHDRPPAPSWWTVDACAPEPGSVLEQQLERAVNILSQLIGMKLLAAWKSLQLAVLTLWNACARSAAIEKNVMEKGVAEKLLAMMHTPAWPASLRDIAGGCLEFFMERYSNLAYIPQLALPDGCKWPHNNSTGPCNGIVAAIKAYITLVDSRTPLLEYRGCHGLSRACFAAPYGATPEKGKEYVRDAKTVAALLGGLDALVALIRRINRRYQDMLAGRFIPLAVRPSTAEKGTQEEDTNQYERDMFNLEAQQDLYFVCLAALANISVLRSAQPLIAKKGLHVLMGTGTILFSQVATLSPESAEAEAEAKLIQLISHVLQNISQHPANRTLMYKAELTGTTAMDRLIEHATEMDDELRSTTCMLPPLTKMAKVSANIKNYKNPATNGTMSPSSGPSSPRISTCVTPCNGSPGQTHSHGGLMVNTADLGSPAGLREGSKLGPGLASPNRSFSGAGMPRSDSPVSNGGGNALRPTLSSGGVASPRSPGGGKVPANSKRNGANSKISRNGQILNDSIDMITASTVRPKVVFPPISEMKEDVWAGRTADGTNRAKSPASTTIPASRGSANASRGSATYSPEHTMGHTTTSLQATGKTTGPDAQGSTMTPERRATQDQILMNSTANNDATTGGAANAAAKRGVLNALDDAGSAAGGMGTRARFLNWLDVTFSDSDATYGSPTSPARTNNKDKNQADKPTFRKTMWDEQGDWLETEVDNSKALSKLLCRPLHHLWNESPAARARHGQNRWQPAISEYREMAPDPESGNTPLLQRPAQRLLATQLPKDDEVLMTAATQVINLGEFESTTLEDTLDYRLDRPGTPDRDQGRIPLTVLQPHPEVVMQAQELEEQLQEALAHAANTGRSIDLSEVRRQILATRNGSSKSAGGAPSTVPLKVVMGPQRPRQIVTFTDAVMLNDDASRPTLTIFEHVDGSRVCEGLFPSYQLPNGRRAYMYYDGGALLDEVAVDAVIPPPRPSTVPQALQQTMPLADVLNLIAKPPGSAPPFIPYKPVPYLVPLPAKHTIGVKRPDQLTASAFGDLREDNLQLILKVKKIVKTQITTRVEPIEVKVQEAREPWTLPMSIFKPRAKESDAHNFSDTEHSLEKMFERDWARACGKEKFTSMMGREHKGNTKAAGKDEKAMLAEVHDVLLQYYQLWYSAFLFYAASSSNDPYHMGMNAFTSFLDECQIPDQESASIKRSDCDTIFIVCNFQPDKKSAEAQVNLETAMMRYEFLEAIVRCAIAKYARGQSTEDIAEAVHLILQDNISANIPGPARHVSNDFRFDRLYNEEVDLVLKRHQVMLKAMYSRYRLKPPGGGLRTKMLRLEGWLQLCSDAHLVDSQFTLQDATLCFLWSRMFVVDEIKDYQRYTSLTFVDFLEAVARVADMKSLPLESDLQATGYNNILEWALEKERMEGGPEGRDGGANSPGPGGDIFRTRDSAGLMGIKTRPLYAKLDLLLDLIFRRLYVDPTNPDGSAFNYDGLLKLIKKQDKDLGP